MIEPDDQRLHWAREIGALAAASHYYARNEFERERAERLQEIAAEMMASSTPLSKAEVMVALRAQPGYVTPKVDVRAAVFREESLLLVREAIDQSWTLPGGWADVGETPRVAIEREVLEETGLVVEARSLVGVYDANRVEGAMSLFHAYKLLFLCEPVTGDLASSLETTEVGFFPVDDLPQPLSTYRTTPRHLADALAAYRQPSRGTVFD